MFNKRKTDFEEAVSMAARELKVASYQKRIDDLVYDHEINVNQRDNMQKEINSLYGQMEKLKEENVSLDERNTELHSESELAELRILEARKGFQEESDKQLQSVKQDNEALRIEVAEMTAKIEAQNEMLDVAQEIMDIKELTQLIIGKLPEIKLNGLNATANANSNGVSN